MSSTSLRFTSSLPRSDFTLAFFTCVRVLLQGNKCGGEQSFLSHILVVNVEKNRLIWNTGDGDDESSLLHVSQIG